MCLIANQTNIDNTFDVFVFVKSMLKVNIIKPIFNFFYANDLHYFRSIVNMLLRVCLILIYFFFVIKVMYSLN